MIRQRNLLIQPSGCKSRLIKVEQDRSVASVAIHWVTGGCEAYTVRKQAVRVQHRNRFTVPMPTFSKRRKAAFGSNRYCEVVLGSAVSLARGMFPKRLAGNPRELPILSHTRRNAFGFGSGDTCNQGSTEGSTEGWLSSLTTP